MRNTTFYLVIVGLLTVLVQAAAAADPGPLKVFILAGQSNMEGQAVVDLQGKDYNQGKGTLVALSSDPAKKDLVAHLKGADGSWRIREDVWVRYQPEAGNLRAGPLGFGFTRYGDVHHFGPELQFGHVVADALGGEVLLIKTAWGGKSLYADFRPPSSGGETGKYYKLMIEQVRRALADVKKDFPKSKAVGYELAGLVWYQGWNDGCDPKNAVPQYEANLVNLIKDVRRDLEAPKLPVVIGELTGPWVKAPGEWGQLRQAQAAAAAHAEFAGNVVFVPTHDFVRKAEDSPNPGHGHHEFGNAETYLLVGDALGKGMLSLLRPQNKPAEPKPPAKAENPARPVKGEMAGYMLVPTERVPAHFNAGFSLYAAAWPLLEHYPGHRFQTGLFGTWMHAQYEGKPPKDLYSDIEGGLGWWRDTRFPTETPKFIMGGVAVNFGEIANGPSHGAGNWNGPRGLYGVAQLSPWLLFPIDGLNIKQGTCGQLFGYGYLPLPLASAKTTTAGKDLPTGDNCWTLFLNTGNFKGPVCFFTPYFWSRAALARPELAGLLLDARPSDPNKAFQMETQYVPAEVSRGEGGERFARVAPIWFPVGADGHTVVLHRLTSYSRAALWDDVQAWFEGGAPPSGAINPAGAFVQQFKGGGGSTWEIYRDGAPKDERRQIDWASLATPFTPDPTTYGYRWNDRFVTRIDHPDGARVKLPEYFHLSGEGRNPKWAVAAPTDVPGASGLAAASFGRPVEKPRDPYDTPSDPQSSFKKPGPVAGPFQARLGDGSVVTYFWYRFADQPAMLNADLTDQQRELMQEKVEKIHRAWSMDREYLAPPTVGKLAQLDPAQIVTPPKGLEVGYVPIATRQELAVPAGNKTEK